MTFNKLCEVIPEDVRKEINQKVIGELFPNLPEKRESDD